MGFSKAAAADDVQYCLNYAEVSEKVLHFVESQSFKLVETVAHQVAALLQKSINFLGFGLNCTNLRQ